MSRHRLLFPKMPRNPGIFRKWLSDQQAAESPRCSQGPAIPESGWGSWESGCQETQNRASQERQFWQALNAFWIVNELAMSADHLLGAQRDLLQRPAVFVNCTHALRAKLEGRSQQPGLFKIRVIDGIDIKSAVVWIRCGILQNQVTPNLNSDFALSLNPGISFVRRGSCQCFSFVFASQWPHQAAIT
jgi:hypothetical protein